MFSNLKSPFCQQNGLLEIHKWTNGSADTHFQIVECPKMYNVEHSKIVECPKLYCLEHSKIMKCTKLLLGNYSQIAECPKMYSVEHSSV